MEKTQEYGDVYYGASCLTKYWIYDEEHKCIAYNQIRQSNESQFDLYGMNEHKSKKRFGTMYPWDEEYLAQIRAKIYKEEEAKAKNELAG